MAVMWPRALPAEVLRDELRAAERKVYDQLATVLDDRWVIFYSRPWLGVGPNGQEIDGECDFLVARADSGFLSLEVKGGRISYDPAAGLWLSSDRWGIRHRIRNPVEQARASKHQLLRKLKARPTWQSRRIRVRHGVILPDSARPSGDLGTDMPAHLFCFLEDFTTRLADWLEERLGMPDMEAGELPLGRDGLAALEGLLARPFSLQTPLGHILAEDDRALQLLTPQQFHILSAIEAVPRAAVAGGAGTGKTILAMEKARRCAATGLRTLLTCFNKPLAAHMSVLMGRDSGVDVLTFHSLCLSSARAAGIEITEDLTRAATLDEVLPELLLQATEVRPDLRYDAIIVDEGQDFRPWWWPALDSMLEPGAGKQLYVFLDSNQKVYQEADVLPRDVGLVPIRLTYNLRNTRRIHEAAGRYYSGHPVEALGPQGVEVEWEEAGSEGLRRRLHSRVEQCTLKQGCAPGDIAVLVAREQEIDQLLINGSIGGHRAVRFSGPGEGNLIIETIRRFKGLERPIVILLADREWIRDPELLYVAFSRPRVRLIIIGTSECIQHLRSTGV